MTGRLWQQYLFIAHRWIGVASCVFVVLWFVSGITMMYIGYPNMNSSERLAHTAPLQVTDRVLPLSTAWKALPAEEHPTAISLSKIAGQPYYQFETSKGSISVDATTGRLRHWISPEGALVAAGAYFPAARGEYLGLVTEDTWSRRYSLNPHRPLHRIQFDDAAHTLVYVSSVTGEVLVTAPRAQRRWNYVGAWLHWLYYFKTSTRSELWRWRLVIITLSGIALLLSATGIIIGLMRWRFRGRNKNGSRSPYRDFVYRWHHIMGLAFACVTVTWLFSGMMSIDPGDVFISGAPPLNVVAYAGGRMAPERFQVEAKDLLDALPADFSPRRIEWRMIDGAPYLAGRNGKNETRVLAASASGQASFTDHLPAALLMRAGGHLMPHARVMSATRLEAYDYYYYRAIRHMLDGNLERPLPVVKLVFDDPAGTWVYLDETTGAIVAHQDSKERLGRVLFLLLHNWDVRVLLDTRPSWDILMLGALLGGTALALTGLVMAYRRVQFTLS